MERERQPGKIMGDVPVRIPVPERLLKMDDPKEQQESLRAYWLSYGYSDRFTLEGIMDGHFIMMRKGG